MTSTISQNSPFPQSAVFPQNTYPQNTFPQSTYPPNTFPQNTFPQSTFPQSTFPQNTFPQSTFPQNSFSSQNSPYPQIQRNSSYQQNHFHPSVRQVQISSSSSLPSSASSASALFPLGTLPPSFDRSHLIDGIPVTYILEKLHLLGSTFYNDIKSAYAELRVNSLPNSTFFVHKEYLILQSIFFRQIFERVKRGDCITITIPAAPETFQPILEYLYTGDDDKWYDTMTVESWSNISKNVSFLGLSPEAKAVCMTFYENYEDEIEQFLNRGGNERVTEGFGAAATHH